MPFFDSSVLHLDLFFAGNKAPFALFFANSYLSKNEAFSVNLAEYAIKFFYGIAHF